MFNVGPLELVLILVVALLVVGPSRLPDVGRSIGRGLREFRRAQDEMQRSLRLSLEDEPPSRPTRVGASSATEDDDASVPGAASGSGPGEAEPTAGSQGEMEDVAKVLGRGLADLRRAKEELQSSFRIDMNDSGDNGSRRPK